MNTPANNQITVTLTIPIDVYDRIFQIMGAQHSIDPDTEYVLSTLIAAYQKRYYPSDEPVTFIPVKTDNGSFTKLIRQPEL